MHAMVMVRGLESREREQGKEANKSHFTVSSVRISYLLALIKLVNIYFTVSLFFMGFYR